MQVYIVRNHEGKYLRSKGRSGYGKNWVDDIAKAKIWPDLGKARAQVTFWYNLAISKNQSQGCNKPPSCPEIIVYNLQLSEILNEEARCQQALEKKIEKELIRKSIYKKQEISRLEASKKALDKELAVARSKWA